MSIYDINYGPQFAQRLIVVADDIKQADVLAYDVECGIITRYTRGDAGNLKVRPASGKGNTEGERGEIVSILNPI